jgi:hypothetical protein
MRKRKESVELWFLIQKPFYFSKEKEKNLVHNKKEKQQLREREKQTKKTTRPLRRLSISREEKDRPSIYR